MIRVRGRGSKLSGSQLSFAGMSKFLPAVVYSASAGTRHSGFPCICIYIYYKGAIYGWAGTIKPISLSQLRARYYEAATGLAADMVNTDKST